MTQPTYYKALWHNCNMCKIHYMSDEPHLRAYLCDDCWKKVPHFVVKKQTEKKKVKKEEWEVLDYLLYIWACLIVISFIVGYIILK
tara:strand:+ start:70 stop:327 length:258 start_codon:yes stop_codon:yes gene_type:complete